jgi:hypothetical protein
MAKRQQRHASTDPGVGHIHHTGIDPDDAPLPRLVRYRDLEKSGIVHNRTQLERLIREQGMPPGRMLSAKTRVWTVVELQSWLNSRPPAGRRNITETVHAGGGRLD